MEPRVSCILATGNRSNFLKQAVKYFMRQTYQNKELIIVDDGSKSSANVVPNDKRIKYVELDKRINLGRKLNIGIEACQGEIIQKLDDDDYYHPKFLTTTVNALRGNDPVRSMAGLDSFLVLIAATGELKFSGHGWFSGGTFCFFRQLWQKKAFQNVPRAVDWWFLKDHQPGRIKIRNPELYIAVRHSYGHTWKVMGKTDVTQFFRRQPNYKKPLKACVSAEDFAFYESLKRGVRRDDSEID